MSTRIAFLTATHARAGSTNRAESQRRWRQPIGGHFGASRRRCLHECSHWCGCMMLALAGCTLVILTWTDLAGVESLDCCGADRSGSTLAHRFDLPDDAQAQPISQVCMWQALCLTGITSHALSKRRAVPSFQFHAALMWLPLSCVCNTAQPTAERTKETPRQKALDSWRRNPRQLLLKIHPPRYVSLMFPFHPLGLGHACHALEDSA